MKSRTKILLLVFALSSISAIVAQTSNYSVEWNTLDAGGGSISGGNYVVESTIGQFDAGQLNGGQYVLNGGFWNTHTLYFNLYLPIVKN